MGTRWVLRTDTKGTGASVVPLDSVQQRPAAPEPLYVPPKPKPRDPKPSEPSPPRRFRIVDVMTRQHIVDDVGAADAVRALKAVHSIVDVSVYVWQPERERWRLLTFPERRAMFDLAAG
jgi:hypothetical protein